MACFPRWFHRQKSSFNPSEDDNIDTILNNVDNTVQIGRYIRREETPVFTPKNSERSVQIQQRRQSMLLEVEQQQKQHALEQEQAQQQEQHINHINGNSVTNNNSNSNNNNSSTNKYNSYGKDSSKKFISKKFNGIYANNNNTSINNYNNNSNSNNSFNNNSSTKTQNANSKFKPVKERRPTALPTDIPQLETDDDSVVDDDNDNGNDDDNGTGDAVDGSGGDLSNSTTGTSFSLCMTPSASFTNTPNATPAITPTTTPANVKFYLPQEQEQEDADDNTTAQRRTTTTTTTTTSITGGSTQRLQSFINTELVPNYTATTVLKTTTSTTTTTESEVDFNLNKMNNKSSSTPTKISLKLPSTTSNKSRKCLSSPRSADSKTVAAPDFYIPPPPPMPPKPLTSATSNVSLVSIRSGKSKRNSSFTAVADNKHNENTSNLNGLAKLSNALQICTVHEMLKISNSYPTKITATATKAKTIALNNLNGRDSGVQVEDSTPSSSPKDSENADTPKSYRVEGGLIFSRANLPVRKDVQIDYIHKDEDTRDLIRRAIEKNDFLNNYMDRERKEMVIDAMESAVYEKNHYIINENDEGSEIYVSEEGEFEVLKGTKVVNSFGAGTVFGELAILYNAKRLASVRVATTARVWKLEREKFRKIMVISGSKEREENLSFMRTAPFLSDLDVEVLNKVVDLLQRKFYETDTCIVREGEVGNEFFIIRGGTVTIKKIMDDGIERVVARRKRGDYFGEQALLNADRRQASVYADAPGTEVLKLDREAFISYLGTIPELHEKPDDRQVIELRESNRKTEFDNEYAHVQLAELKKIATLGAGAFGRVDLVAYGQKTFALKVIKKIDIVKQDQVDHVYSEKHVMMKCSSSPFIIELYKTFRNEKFVYFLMEACMGGDVWTVMSQRRFFDEKTAKFIAGCVVEAFDFLHSHNIIYRDLKPENLMLSTDGYCKLVDFGFAKHIPPNQKTNTFAGTPEYVAPEIILDRGHDRAVDYWALGILIFELLVGRTPFRGQNQIKIYQQILGGIDVIQMPSKIPKPAQGLIKHLCKQLPAERLGYQRRGIQDIKRHSWFDSLDWNKLKRKQLTSPIKRTITSNVDLQYFVPTGVENDCDPPDETSGWDVDF